MHDGGPHQNSGPPSYGNQLSPAIARRKRLTRTKSSPVLLSLLSGGGVSGAGTDLPPLVGAPCDPNKLSRYANSQEKIVSGSVGSVNSPTKTTDSPVITRRGRQLKPHLVRQGSEPQLSRTFSELKLVPSPPGATAGDHGVQSPRSNGSSCCNSPRSLRRPFGRSADGLNTSGSSLTLRTSFPNPSQPLSSPTGTPRPHSPLITSDSPFSIFHSPSTATASSTTTTPVLPRHGVRKRRTSGRDDVPDAAESPGQERYQLSVCLPAADDHSTRSRSTWPPRQSGFYEEEPGLDNQYDDKFIHEPTMHRAIIDDETGEPILTTSREPDYNIPVSTDQRYPASDFVNKVNVPSHPGDHHHASLEEGHHPGHSAFVTNQNSGGGTTTDMLYDIKETQDEVVHESFRNNQHEHHTAEPSESEEEVDSEGEKLPEYQKPPLPSKNRINQWLEGLQPSNDNDDNIRIAGGTILPNI